jgi:hypothetical protein
MQKIFKSWKCSSECRFLNLFSVSLDQQLPENVSLYQHNLLCFRRVVVGSSSCSLVVRVPGYRSRGLGSIPGATRFSEKWWVWNGVHSASWLQSRSYLKEKVAAPSLKIRDYSHRESTVLTTWHPSICRKLALTSQTSDSHSVGIVWSRTQATEFFLFVCLFVYDQCIWQNISV